MAELKVKSNTVSAVDLFKCIFAICVVAIHTMAFKDHGESAYFAFTYCITSFAVPYFFVCSGYFLGRKIYRKDLQKSDYRLIIKNYAQRLLKPYLIWGCWYFLIVLVNEIVRNHKNVIEALKSGIHNWIVSSPGGGLWYVQALLIMLIILYYCDKHRSKKIVGIAVGLLVCFFIPDILKFIKLPLVDLVVGTYNSIFLTTNNFVWWGIYFFIGILLNESRFKEKYSCFKVSYQWMIVIAIYLIYMCVYWIFGKKFLIVSHLLKLIIVGIVFITTLNTKLNLKVESSLYMRKMSAIIYFTHFTLVYAFQFLFKIIGISLETNYTFEFVLCTISVIVYSHFIMNWKDGKNFLSVLY